MLIKGDTQDKSSQACICVYRSMRTYTQWHSVNLYSGQFDFFEVECPQFNEFMKLITRSSVLQQPRGGGY